MPLRLLFRIWLIGLLLVTFSYLFLDRPLADFIHSHHWRTHLTAFKYVVEWPPVVAGLAPFLLFILLILRLNTPVPTPIFRMLLVLCFSVIFTYILKNDFKWAFSRFWPETWNNNNLSWIQNHAYGFQWFQGKPFQGTDATGSFPSGHSAIAFASLLPVGLYYPRLLWTCMILAAIEAFSMLAFNYHFLSDIIAGALLGSTCAILCVRYDLSR